MKFKNGDVVYCSLFDRLGYVDENEWGEYLIVITNQGTRDDVVFSEWAFYSNPEYFLTLISRGDFK